MTREYRCPKVEFWRFEEGCASLRSSMKAEAGLKPVPLSSSPPPPDPSEELKNPAKGSVTKGFRPSFTPNIFSSFEQFDLSLKKVAARADSAVRKRKPLGKESRFSYNKRGDYNRNIDVRKQRWLVGSCWVLLDCVGQSLPCGSCIGGNRTLKFHYTF